MIRLFLIVSLLLMGCQPAPEPKVPSKIEIDLQKCDPVGNYCRIGNKGFLYVKDYEVKK